MAGNASGARRWPAAALLAASIVLAFDALVLGPDGIWEWFETASQARSAHARAVLRDRLRLAALRRDDRGEALITVLGSSRAARGVGQGFAPPGHRESKLAHQLIGPLEIRCAVEDLLETPTSAVVLPLSEFDTHGTSIYDAMRSDASFRNWRCLWDLLVEAGPRHVFERRDDFLRLAAASTLRAYQRRPLWWESDLDRLFRFAGSTKLRRADRETIETVAEIERELRADASLLEMVQSLNQRFPGRGSLIHRGQFRLVREISAGEHARIQIALLGRAVARLRAAGVDVLVVETPLYPGAHALYDREVLAEEFRRAAAGWQADLGAGFLALEQQPGYGSEQFGDLTHLNPAGARQLTAAIESALRRLLSAEPI